MANNKPLLDLNVSGQSLRHIIVEGNAQELVAQAEMIGTKLGSTLTTNQIRAIFGTVRQIEMNWNDVANETRRKQAQRQLVLLKPKMMYRASKDGFQGRGLQALADVLAESIDLVMDEKATDKQERFGRFMEFFEAILAYHNVAGSNKGGTR